MIKRVLVAIALLVTVALSTAPAPAYSVCAWVDSSRGSVGPYCTPLPEVSNR